MTAAVRPLTLPPEADAIIAEGAPKPQTVGQTVTVDSAKVQSLPNAAPMAAPKSLARPKSETGREGENDVFVSATFRLPTELLAMLLKASSERKLKKIEPFTQQDIVAEALAGWLQKNG